MASPRADLLAQLGRRRHRLRGCGRHGAHGSRAELLQGSLVEPDADR